MFLFLIPNADTLQAYSSSINSVRRCSLRSPSITVSTVAESGGSVMAISPLLTS